MSGVGTGRDGRSSNTVSRQVRVARAWLALSIAIAATVAIAVLLIATQFRLIADDYAHVAGVLARGVTGNTSYWFGIELAGIPGLLLLSGFAWFVGHLPWSIGMVPYVVLVVATVWAFGSVAVAVMGARGTQWSIGIGLLAVPLWVLSIGNVLGQYDVQSLMGMLNWISASYRTTLPLWFASLFLALAASAKWTFATRLLVGAGGSLAITLSSLNLLPDLGAYLVMSLVAAAFLSTKYSTRTFSDPRAIRQAFSASAVGIATGLILLWFAPATSLRRERHPSQLSWHDGPAAFLGQLGNFMREWMNVSNVLVMIVVAGATVMVLAQVEPEELKPATTRVRQRATIFAVAVWLLVAMLVVTGAFGDVLTYGGVFHRWSVEQVAFIGFVALGVLVGATVLPKVAKDGTVSSRRMALVGATMVVCLLVTLVPLTRLAAMASERRALWETGQPAPLGFMADRDSEAWLEAWHQIESRRPDADPTSRAVGR